MSKVFYSLTPEQAKAAAATERTQSGMVELEAGIGKVLHQALGDELMLKLGQAIKAGHQPVCVIVPPDSDRVAGLVWTEEEEVQAREQMETWLAEVDACPLEVMVEIEVGDWEGTFQRTVGVCRHHARMGAAFAGADGLAAYDQFERANGIGARADLN